MSEVVISSHMPDVVDSYIAIRAQRLQADRVADELASQENVLKEHIINHFRSAGLSALGGKVGMVKMKVVDEPDPQDWQAIWKYIQDTGAFELLHKRLGVEAVRERWAAGVQVPGVGHKDVYKLSVSNV